MQSINTNQASSEVVKKKSKAQLEKERQIKLAKALRLNRLSFSVKAAIPMLVAKS